MLVCAIDTVVIVVGVGEGIRRTAAASTGVAHTSKVKNRTQTTSNVTGRSVHIEKFWKDK